jgi:outer membrane protein assembly factor BamA
VSDADELDERYTGIEARYENAHLAGERVRLRFEFDTYHQQWNRNTLEAAAAEGLEPYRTRENFQPSVGVRVARPLTVSFGASFETMADLSRPDRETAANSLIASARYHREWENAASQQFLDGVYDLRAATRGLASDSGYTRHRWDLHYQFTQGRHQVTEDFAVGALMGRAPLFERFVLGNSTALRGWNKYDLDPIGGNRMVRNSVEYRYGVMQLFYDSGAVWGSGRGAAARNSIGAGLRQGPFSLAVAFPLREGKVEPVFIVGMNY